MSNISEVIEVWMKVQAKWMYLEAIFIGSEDIRLQLPEEAKRFDRIHAAFKKIMAETQKKTVVTGCPGCHRMLSVVKDEDAKLEDIATVLHDRLQAK